MRSRALATVSPAELSDHASTKRQRILAAAVEHFNYYGIAKTTMQDIAAAAGVAVGTLYLYFKSKDDLLVGCMENFIAEHQAMAEALLARREPAATRLRHYLLERFRISESLRVGSRHAAELARAVFRLRPERCEEEGQLMVNYLVRLIEQGNATHEFHVRDPRRDAEILLYSIAYFYPHALMTMVRYPTAEELLKVVDWFIETFQRPWSDAMKSHGRAAKNRSRATTRTKRARQ
jgi:AcrR family transcriptional regulator